MQRDHILPGENLKATDQDFRALGEHEGFQTVPIAAATRSRHGPPGVGTLMLGLLGAWSGKLGTGLGKEHAQNRRI
jgi:hypothetical protein